MPPQTAHLSATPVPVSLRVEEARVEVRSYIWQRKLQSAVAGELARDNLAFVYGAGPQGLAALSLQSGTIVWSRAGSYAAVQVSRNFVYAFQTGDSGSSDASVLTLDAATGALVHTTPIRDCGRLIGFHTVHDVLIAVCANRVVGIDTASGSVGWNTDSILNYFGTDDFTARFGVAAISERPLAEGNPQLVNGVDVSSGKARWRINNASIAGATSNDVLVNDLMLADNAQAQLRWVRIADGILARSIVTKFPPDVGYGIYPALVSAQFAYYFVGVSAITLIGNDFRLIGIDMDHPEANANAFRLPGFPVGKTSSGLFVLKVGQHAMLFQPGANPSLVSGIPGMISPRLNRVWIGRGASTDVLSRGNGFMYIAAQRLNAIIGIRSNCRGESIVSVVDASQSMLSCAARDAGNTISTVLLFNSH